MQIGIGSLSPKIRDEIEVIVLDTASRQRRDFTFENRVIATYCLDPAMYPRDCADKLNAIYSHNETGDSITSILKKCNLIKYHERSKIYSDAHELLEKLLKCLAGDQVQIANLDVVIRHMDSHPQKKRIILNYLFMEVPGLNGGKAHSEMMRMNKDFAAEAVEAIVTYITLEMGSGIAKKDYEKEIYRLESNLSRANKMLMTLQDEFEDRLAENRVEEQTNVISMLNSAKYGYILDLLVSAQSGFKQLRSKKIDVPYEINAMPTLIRKIFSFVDDCGITQILEVGSVLKVSAKDIRSYTYEGTPFLNESETKTISVISPGWEIKQKEIIISNPLVKELEVQ